MPAISTDNGNITRRASAAVDPIYFNVFPLVEVATAKVNGTPDFTARVNTLTVDTTSVNWLSATRRGQVVRVFDLSGVMVFEGVSRRVPTSTTIPIAAMREGDTGTAQQFGQTIADNYDVKVYSAIVPSAMLSYIDEDGVLYKRDDIEHDDSYPQSQYPYPHARFGTHRHSRVVEGASATLSFTDNSYDFAGDALSRVWAEPSTWTQTVGTSTSASVTYTAPAGNYIMRLQSIRTGGVEETDDYNAFRYIFVTDGPDGDNPAFSDLFNVQVRDIVQDRVGCTITAEIKCDAGDETTLLTYLYPGAFCLMQETPKFSADGYATEGTPTAGIVYEVTGHLRSYERVAVDPYGVQTWLVKFESAMTYCASLPIPTQVFRRSTTPVEWYEVHPDLLDVGGMMYISLVYSTEVPRLYDLYFEDVRGAQIPYAEFDKGSILNGFQQLMQRVTGGNIGSVASGAIYARRSGSHEDDTYRNALATVWTWSASDIDGGVDYRRDPIYKVGQLTGAGAVAGTALSPLVYRAQAGYLAASQGLDTSATMPGFIGSDQTDIQERVGHEYQYRNRAITDFTFVALGNRDVADPALMEWHKFSIDSYVPLDDTTFSTSRRWLPNTVTRTYEYTPTGVKKRVVISAIPETKGKAAPLLPTKATGAILGPVEANVTPGDELDSCETLTGVTGADGFIHDFTGGTESWVVNSTGSATYSAGWSSVLISFGYVRENSAYIKRSWSNAPGGWTVIRIEITYTATLGAGEKLLQVRDRFGSGAQSIFQTTELSAGTDNVYVWTGSSVMYDGMKVYARAGYRKSIPASDPGGTVTITKVRVCFAETAPI